MKKTFFDTLLELVKGDPNLVFIKGDTAYVPQLQAACPDQYLDVGIAEQNMIGVAAGMALEGKTPITYSIVNFSSMRCLEQIRNTVAYHNLNVKVISCGAGFDYGFLGATHHATEDLGIMRGMPNMTVFSPCDPYETVAVLKAAVKLNGPCFIRIGHGGEKNLHSAPLETFEVGQAYELVPGQAISIFATGAIAADAVEAAQCLHKSGYDVGVYSVPTLKPIDRETIAHCARQSKLIVTVEEHNIFGGLGSAVAEIMAETPGTRAILRRVGMRDAFAKVVGTQEFLKKTYCMDADGIIEDIQEGLKEV